jgi:glucokinase
LYGDIKSPERPALAIDIGGTKMNVAIISREGEITARRTVPTQAAQGPETVVGRLVDGMDGLIADAGLTPRDLAAIGIAAAGVIDTRNGMVTTSPNLPGWNNIPLRSLLADRYGRPASLINDADAAALGEHRFGSGKGHNTIIVLTVGTGIGGGIIANGELFLGPNFSAAELGHMVIDVNGPKCACGSQGCLEALASGTAVAREARGRLQRGARSSLMELSGGEVQNVTAETVHRAARTGDELANQVIAQAAFYLGIGVINVVNIFNPEAVIIGGSLSAMGDLLLQPVRDLVAERAMPALARSVHIAAAQLGNDAGLFGAAVYALEH